MHASSDEKFLYELFSNGTDIPGYCRLKRCLVDFEQISAQVHAVLDAGCGGGSKSVYLARNHPALKCHGTDIDENSLRNAEMMKARYRLENASFSQRDLVRCNDLGIFDFVIISDVLEHIDDDAQAARNIDTMLSPGGYLHLNVPAKEHDHDFSKLSPGEQEDLRRWLKDIGHVRLGYSFDEIQRLFPRYEIMKMRKAGNCCYKIAFFFWEKVIFDPSRKPAEIKKEYTLPFASYLDLLINKYLVKAAHPAAPQEPLVNERMFLQAIRTIDLGIDLEEKGLLDRRYLIEEEICCLLRKPRRS